MISSEKHFNEIVSHGTFETAIDIGFLHLFLLYAAHVIISPYDGQFLLENAEHSVSHGYFLTATLFLPVVLIYLVSRLKKIGNSLLFFKGLLGIVFAFAVLSLIWSVDIVKTLRAAIDASLLLSLPVLIVQRNGVLKTLHHICLFLCILLSTSFFVSAIGSPYGLMSGVHEGLWRGVFGHKNHFGVFLFVVFAFVVYAPKECFPYFKLRVLSAAAVLLSAYMCNSSTLYVMLFITVVFVPHNHIPNFAKLPRLLKFGFVPITMVSAVLIWPDLIQVLSSILGKDSSFTGRTTLWAVALQSIESSPFLGFGYGTSGGVETLGRVQRESGWLIAPSLHNGLITLALDLGLVVVGVWVIWLARILLRNPSQGSFNSSLTALVHALTFGLIINSLADSVASFYLNISSVTLLFVVAAINESQEVTYLRERL
jgi:exopolysaccharide production protein ExoQ